MNTGLPEYAEAELRIIRIIKASTKSYWNLKKDNRAEFNL